MMRREVAPGVFLSELGGDFKKSRLAIYAASPLSRETVTATAMLPFLFERGTRRLPDMTMFRRRQNALYGAALSANYSIVGFSRVLDGLADGIDGAYIDDAGLARERAALLLDMLFDPCVEDGRFSAESVDIERQKLRETIQSVINDKREYCLKLLMESFFSGDERALPGDGFEEDLEGIDGAGLYDVYRAFMEAATIEVIQVGSPVPQLADMLCDVVGRDRERPAAVKPLTAVEKRPETRIVRPMDIEQDKLALAFTAGRLLGERDLTALRVAASVYGSSPTSRLFVNVREKQSLCYYASAQISYRAGGGLLVDCGIAHENAGRAREAVLHELELLAENGPTATEVDQIKLMYRNALQGVTDSGGALANYYYNNLVKYGRPVSVEEELAMIEEVTREKVRDLLAEMNLNASCLLCGKEDK